MGEENRNQGKKYETRSVKRLNTPKMTSAYQKEWFRSLRPRVENGEPFVLIGSESPMEILQAMDIPFVVQQWWTAICAAKQMSPYFYDLLGQAGYRNDICSYCAAAYACSLDPKPEEGPWGGLPKPSIVICTENCSSGMKIEELMVEAFEADSFRIQHMMEEKITPDWWDHTLYDWENMFGKERADFYERELQLLVSFLEDRTGRKLERNRLIEVLNNVNEQEEWFRRTRDLIAETIPSPVTVTDTVNAVQQAQWHRGTKKGIEMAKSLYDEVKALADNKIAAVPNEKYRLMWLGRGVWFNLAFYQHFEEKYGATFVWTQYLGQAADSFIRYGVEENPLRSLATRFAYLYENLHITPMNAEWYVKEAKHNKVDGVVYLVTENCMNNGDFAVNIIRRLEEEGFPVCVLHADPADAKKWDQDKMVAMVEEHIEKRIIPRKQENVL